MKRLAWWLIRAQFQTRRTATALSMLAIALGVALGYAIHLINDAALADFSQAMKSVQGEPDAVVAPQDSAGRVPLALINELAQDEGVALVVPVIETRVRIGELAVRSCTRASRRHRRPQASPRPGSQTGRPNDEEEDPKKVKRIARKEASHAHRTLLHPD